MHIRIAEGRVFVMKDGKYLELQHRDDGRKVTVNIPDGYRAEKKTNTG